jgi:hypothetical protein
MSSPRRLAPVSARRAPRQGRGRHIDRQKAGSFRATPCFFFLSGDVPGDVCRAGGNGACTRPWSFSRRLACARAISSCSRRSLVPSVKKNQSSQRPLARAKVTHIGIDTLIMVNKKGQSKKHSRMTAAAGTLVPICCHFGNGAPETRYRSLVGTRIRRTKKAAGCAPTEEQIGNGGGGARRRGETGALCRGIPSR